MKCPRTREDRLHGIAKHWCRLLLAKDIFPSRRCYLLGPALPCSAILDSPQTELPLGMSGAPRLHRLQELPGTLWPRMLCGLPEKWQVQMREGRKVDLSEPEAGAKHLQASPNQTLQVLMTSIPVISLW